MIQLLSLHYGKNTEAYLKQFPVKYFDNDDDYFWEVIGSSRRNIPLLEARREDGSLLLLETQQTSELAALLSTWYSQKTGLLTAI